MIILNNVLSDHEKVSSIFKIYIICIFIRIRKIEGKYSSVCLEVFNNWQLKYKYFEIIKCKKYQEKNKKTDNR